MTQGVYYRFEDYAGFWRRFAIDLIDLCVGGGASLVAMVVFAFFLPVQIVLLIGMAVSFAYFVLLKMSRGGTVGYRALGFRVVRLDGRTPGIGGLTLRWIMMGFGPLNYLADLTWLSDDRHRQALRDKITQTYVIRKNAVPIGSGPLVYRFVMMCGQNLLFREVKI